MKSKAARPSTLLSANSNANAGVKVTEHVPTPKRTPAPKGKTKSSAAPNVENILNHRRADSKHEPPWGSRVPGWGDPDRPGRK